MAYKIAYTRRFEKNYKKLTSSEKRQIKTKVEILSDAGLFSFVTALLMVRKPEKPSKYSE